MKFLQNFGINTNFLQIFESLFFQMILKSWGNFGCIFFQNCVSQNFSDIYGHLLLKFPNAYFLRLFPKCKKNFLQNFLKIVCFPTWKFSYLIYLFNIFSNIPKISFTIFFDLPFKNYSNFSSVFLFNFSFNINVFPRIILNSWLFSKSCGKFG